MPFILKIFLWYELADVSSTLSDDFELISGDIDDSSQFGGFDTRINETIYFITE